MRLAFLALAITFSLSGCINAVATKPVATTTSPTATPPPSPAVVCGDLSPKDCRAGASAALSAAQGRGGSPIRVELGRGVWCPTPGLLFVDTTCPGGGLPPAGGGQWIGHALITFGGSQAQAYINLAKNGEAITGAFVALATPPVATSSPY